MTFQKILVPTDFSTCAEQAEHIAIDLARTHGASITLLHVYDPVAYPLPDGYMMYSPGQLAQPWAELDARLERARADAAAAGVPSVEKRLLEGLTANEILSYAEREGHDLIVMGTHGRTGLGRVLFGSVATRVVQQAHCPVLAVKAPAVAAAG